MKDKFKLFSASSTNFAVNFSLCESLKFKSFCRFLLLLTFCFLTSFAQAGGSSKFASAQYSGNFVHLSTEGDVIQNDWLMVYPSNYTFTVQTVITVPQGWFIASPPPQQIQMDFTGMKGAKTVVSVTFRTYKQDWMGNPDNEETINAKVWVIGYQAGEDADSDGLLDSWEMQHFGNLNQGSNDDPDGDGISNGQEQLNGTDPNDPPFPPLIDEDEDGLSDDLEIMFWGDLDEQSGSDDADGDGVTNQQEQQQGSNPNDSSDEGGSVEKPKVSCAVMPLDFEHGNISRTFIDGKNRVFVSAYSQDYSEKSLWLYQQGQWQKLFGDEYEVRDVNERGEVLLRYIPANGDGEYTSYIFNADTEELSQLGDIADPNLGAEVSQDYEGVIGWQYIGSIYASGLEMNNEGNVVGLVYPQYNIFTKFYSQSEKKWYYYTNTSSTAVVAYWPDTSSGYMLKDQHWIDQGLSSIVDVNDQSQVSVNHLSGGMYFWSQPFNDYSIDPFATGGPREITLTEHGLLHTVQVGNHFFNQMASDPNEIYIGIQPMKEINYQAQVAIGDNFLDNNGAIWKYDEEKERYFAYEVQEVTEESVNDNLNYLVLDDVNTNGLISAHAEDNKVVLLPIINITNLWSDQLPGVHANWIQKADDPNEMYMTGQDSKPYILMGAREDGKAYVKAQLKDKLPENFEEAMLFRLSIKGQNNPKPGSSSYDSVKREVSITAENLGNTEEDYVVVAGYDANQNAQLEASEISYKNDWVCKVVSAAAYANRIDDLLDWKAIFFNIPLSEACLDAFLTESTPVGANSVPIEIPRFPLYATHAVGVLFQPVTDPGSSIKAIFDSNSDMTAAVMNSTALKNWLENEFDLKQNYVQQTLNNTTNVIETFNWQLPAMQLDFGFLSDADLAGSLKHISSLGPIHVMLKVEVATGKTTEVKVTGTLEDLYDFDYDGNPSIFVKPGACVQAGYNTLGIAGRVYKIEVQMDNSLWSREYDFD